MDSITLYDVTEDELKQLEDGPPGSNQLNFAIACLTTAVSMTVTLSSTPVDDPKVFTFFVVMLVVGYVFGVYCLIDWWIGKRNTTSASEKIRLRLKRKEERIISDDAIE